MEKKPNLRMGAELLEKVRMNAEYWLDSARAEADRNTAVIAMEQSANAWKNAAYALAEALVARTTYTAETADSLRKKYGDLQGSMLVAYEWELDQTLRSYEHMLRLLVGTIESISGLPEFPSLREPLRAAKTLISKTP